MTRPVNPLTPPALFPSTPQAQNPRQGDRQQANLRLAQTVLDMGMSFLGTPYVWGGAKPGGFDCSGLLQYIFAQNGVTIPRVSRDQARFGTPVSVQHARPGDLVAFDNSRERPGVDHIGIYLGNGLMLQAPRTGRNVEVVRVDLNRAVTIRRVLPENAFQSMSAGPGRWNYSRATTVRIGQGATPPTAVTPESGGGDPASNPTGPPGAATPPGVARPPGANSRGGAVTTPQTSSQVLSSTGNQLSGFGTGPSGNYRPEDYGFSFAFFGSDPELKALVDKAVQEQWEPDKFAIELRNSQWYRARSESDREWTALLTGDPGSAQRQFQTRLNELKAAAGKMGVKLTDEQMNKLADDSIRFGYSAQEIQRNLGGYVAILDTPSGIKGDMVGDAGTLLDKYKLKTRAFGLNVPEQRLADFVRRVMMGDDTEESFDRWIKEQAKALYPTMAGFIDRGLTVEDVASNYQQVMARTLEVDPTTVDFMRDPLLKRALFGQSPDDKLAQPMSMWEFERLVKQDPRWMKTSGARDQLMGVTGEVLRNFGFKS